MRRLSYFVISPSLWLAIACGISGSELSVSSQEDPVSSKPVLAQWIDLRFEDYFAENDQQIETVDDATFLRRVYLDLAGRIPSISEIRDFTDSKVASKRVDVVDELLKSDRYGVHFARVWRRVLMPPGGTANANFATTLDDWLTGQLQGDVRYDEIARRLVTAGGADEAAKDAIRSEIESQPENPFYDGMLKSTPTAFLQSTGGSPASMASSVSRVFLGVRLECAQCHDHPFTDWTQQDFWGVAAFFADAKLTARVNRQADDGEEQTAEPPVDGRNTAISDEDGNSYDVSLPWDGPDAEVSIPESELPRQYFARWLTSSENPHFAATAVNRVWQQLCGKGLTHSVDDLDQANDVDREVVLDGLAEKFAVGGYDLKSLIRAICSSDYYQRPSVKTDSENGIAPRPLKVMTPEQVFDSYEVAVALPISSIDRGPRFNGEREALVSRMEEALGEGPDDFRSGIPQALTLMNGKTTDDATSLVKSRTLRAILDAPFLDMNEKLDTLFLVTLSRTPHESERVKLMEYIQQESPNQDVASAFSSVMWALINSPEFVLVR